MSDNNGNTYTFDDNSFTVSRISTVYISPAGTGSGAASTSRTTWDNVASIITSTGTVEFDSDTYTNFKDKSISQSWTLNGNNAVLDAGNSGRIFTVSGDNVKINGKFTFQNAKATNGNGGAILWSGANGQLSGATFTSNVATGNGGAVYWSGDSGSITDCNFADNTAANSNVRNIYIEGTNKVTTKDNVYDVKLTYSISDATYGNAASVTGTFDAGVNFALNDILKVNSSSSLQDTLSSNQGSFTIVVNGLNAGTYNITATSTNGNKYNYKPDSTKNFKIDPKTITVTVNSVGSVVYGMQDEIEISGSVDTVLSLWFQLYWCYYC